MKTNLLFIIIAIFSISPVFGQHKKSYGIQLSTHFQLSTEVGSKRYSSNRYFSEPAYGFNVKYLWSAFSRFQVTAGLEYTRTFYKTKTIEDIPGHFGTGNCEYKSLGIPIGLRYDLNKLMYAHLFYSFNLLNNQCFSDNKINSTSHNIGLDFGFKIPITHQFILTLEPSVFYFHNEPHSIRYFYNDHLFYRGSLGTLFKF